MGGTSLSGQRIVTKTRARLLNGLIVVLTTSRAHKCGVVYYTVILIDPYCQSGSATI